MAEEPPARWRVIFFFFWGGGSICHSCSAVAANVVRHLTDVKFSLRPDCICSASPAAVASRCILYFKLPARLGSQVV